MGYPNISFFSSLAISHTTGAKSQANPTTPPITAPFIMPRNNSSMSLSHQDLVPHFFLPPKPTPRTGDPSMVFA